MAACKANRNDRRDRAARPELVVVYRPMLALAPAHVRRVLAPYRPIDDRVPEPLRPEFSLWVLRDGRLAGRLGRACDRHLSRSLLAAEMFVQVLATFI